MDELIKGESLRVDTTSPKASPDINQGLKIFRPLIDPSFCESLGTKPLAKRQMV